MTDARLRELEREDGPVEQEAALLRERLRRGELTLGALELCAYLGHWPAQLALDGPPPAGEFVPFERWSGQLTRSLWLEVIAVGCARARRWIVAASRGGRALPAESRAPRRALRTRLRELQRWSASQGTGEAPALSYAWDELDLILDDDELATEVMSLGWNAKSMSESPARSGTARCLERACGELGFAERAVPALLLDRSLRRAARPASEPDYLESCVATGRLSAVALQFAGRSGHAGAAELYRSVEMGFVEWAHELSRAPTQCLLAGASSVSLASVGARGPLRMRLVFCALGLRDLVTSEAARGRVRAVMPIVRELAEADAQPLTPSRVGLIEACLELDRPAIRQRLVELWEALAPDRSAQVETEAKRAAVRVALSFDADFRHLGCGED
ncbi:MAG: hypothetical protein AB7N76_15755 [Planctomycetota bacterium]